METNSYDGIADISKDVKVPFHFENDEIEFYLGGNSCTFEEGKISVLGRSHTALTGGMIYFHFPTPLQDFGAMEFVDESGNRQKCSISIGNVKHNVDFYIKNFEEQSEFTQLKFSFPELNCFQPSSGAAYLCEIEGNLSELMFSRTPKKITEFSFEFMDRKINFILRIYAEGQFSTQSTALTKTELLLEFEKTNDLDFLVKLFTVVDDMFCFLCNRRNITLNCATLVGERAQKYPNRKDGKTFIDERHVYTSQTLVVINKYKDKGENEKAIQKTIQYTLLSKCFEQLFSMFVDNEVSIFSIHSSLAARSLIDLKQSLHITATFEYYYRRYIPDIPSEDSLEFYNEIKGLLQEYVNNNTGKKRKKLKVLLKGSHPNHH